MPIERFTKEQFEAALPLNTATGDPLWTYGGFDKGEHIYYLDVIATNKRLVIRSSVDRSGRAAETGADSIRLWIEYYYDKSGRWHPLKKHQTRWTTREPGWAERMTDKLRELYQLALDDSKAHKGGNKNGKTSTTNATDISASKEQQPKREVSASPVRDHETQPPSDPLDFLGDAPPPMPTPPDLPTDPDSAEFEEALDFLDTSPAPPILSEAELAADDQVEAEEQVAQAKVPNAQQLEAIEAPIDQAVVVLAGPGTGKTFVIARRYAFLLENGVKPEQILAVTFSKDMADELLARIKRVNPQVAGTAAEQQVSTIHACCYRLLKGEGDSRGVVKTWILKKHTQSIAEDLWPYSSERPGWEEIVGWINTAKFHGLTSAEDLEFFVEAVGHYHGSRLHDCRRRLDHILREKERALTFSDMLLDVEVKLREDRDFRERCQQRFGWVIVDEGQDTSAQAMRILTSLAAPQDRFFIVGDTDQLLYRFAGATPEANLFEGFWERYPDGLLVKLFINYRSNWEIIEAYNRMIQNNYSERGGPYDQKFLKYIKPRDNAPQGDPITWQMFEGPEEEAVALALEIKAKLDSGQYQPGDFFAGFRTRAQGGFLEGPLMRLNVPFINAAGFSFWSLKHVADVMAYVRLAYDETDSEAFQRVYNIGSNRSTYPWGAHQGEYCTHRFLGRAFLQECTDYKTGKPSYQWAERAARSQRKFRPGVDDLTFLLRDVQADMAYAENGGDLVDAVLDKCYVKYLKHDEGLTSKDESENGKLEDLLTVRDIAAEFEDVGLFIEYVKKAQAAAEAVKDKAEWSRYVVISTVHRLKGLERRVVYGIGLSENGQQGLLPHTFSMSDPPQHGILPGNGRGRVEDERCIGYVLVSRAKEEVHLSGVYNYRKMQLGPSRFIAEMGLTQVHPAGRTRAKFQPGQIVSTPGALDAFEASGEDPTVYLARHLNGDWGEVTKEDAEENEFSIDKYLRILSSYTLKTGTRVWIITEADRSATTFLLPEEY